MTLTYTPLMRPSARLEVGDILNLMDGRSRWKGTDAQKPEFLVTIRVDCITLLIWSYVCCHCMWQRWRIDWSVCMTSPCLTSLAVEPWIGLFWTLHSCDNCQLWTVPVIQQKIVNEIAHNQSILSWGHRATFNNGYGSFIQPSEKKPKSSVHGGKYQHH